MIDYICERKNLNVSQSITYMRANKGLAVGNWLIFSLLFNIPFIGVIVASVLSPVAACCAAIEEENN